MGTLLESYGFAKQRCHVFVARELRAGPVVLLPRGAGADLAALSGGDGVGDGGGWNHPGHDDGRGAGVGATARRDLALLRCNREVAGDELGLYWVGVSSSGLER